MCGYNNIYDSRLKNNDKPLCKKDKNSGIFLSDYELEILQLELRETYKTFKNMEKIIK